MSPNADVSLIQSFLDHVAKRLGAIAAFEGAAGGLALATVLLLLRWSSKFNMAVTAVVVLLSIVAGVGVRLFMLAQERQQVAREVERAAPGCHNLVVAAEEILRNPERVRESVASLVFSQAAAAVRLAGGLQVSDRAAARGQDVGIDVEAAHTLVQVEELIDRDHAAV